MRELWHSVTTTGSLCTENTNQTLQGTRKDSSAEDTAINVTVISSLLNVGSKDQHGLDSTLNWTPCTKYKTILSRIKFWVADLNFNNRTELCEGWILFIIFLLNTDFFNVIDFYCCSLTMKNSWMSYTLYFYDLLYDVLEHCLFGISASYMILLQ